MRLKKDKWVFLLILSTFSPAQPDHNAIMQLYSRPVLGQETKKLQLVARWRCRKTADIEDKGKPYI